MAANLGTNSPSSCKQVRLQSVLAIPQWRDWERRFGAAQKVVASALAAGDTVKILSLVFDRLYVSRNQMVHGGSTWGGKVNRHQVRDGAAILGFLLPVFVDLMMDNPHEDWGVPFYPVVDE